MFIDKILIKEGEQSILIVNLIGLKMPSRVRGMSQVQMQNSEFKPQCHKKKEKA
jgi:hypothetical protein